MLAGMTFLFPWLLGGLLLIPVLWWLLRIMPPRPRAVQFPAFFLLQDLKTDVKTASKTPWWLLLLRSLIVLLFVLALAEPVMRMSQGLPGKGGSVLVVVDNGYAAAAGWGERMARLREFMPQIGRSDRSVIFLPTAASPSDGKLRAYGPMGAGEAEKWIETLKPYPWPADHAAASALVTETAAAHPVSHALMLSDGTAAQEEKETRALMDALLATSSLTVVRDNRINNPHILRRKPTHPSEMSLTLERLVKPQLDERMMMTAYSAEGNVIDETTFVFPGGAQKADVQWEMLDEIKSRIARVGLRQLPMASAVFLTDSQWQQHTAGVLGDARARESASVLSEVYYLRRALAATGKPVIGSVEELTAQPMSAVIWPDSTALTAVERVQLLEWVRAGGFLIRFAGPNLAGSPEDPLLPVGLRYGQRAMQGALTWEKPVGLGAVPEHSPLLGLDVPKDVTVTRQVLATPSPEVFERTWLTLSDGTPLLTGGRVGSGTVVLVHTSAGPDWSDFCYSGLYVEALQRLVSLSAGAADFRAESILSPMMLMDAFGRLETPDPRSMARPLDPRQKFVPSPETPPGIYGVEKQFKVFNLGNALPEMKPLGSLPAGADEDTYQLAGERSLKPDLLRLALLLLLVDTLVTLFLRGVINLPPRFAGTAAVMLCLLVLSSPAQAQDVPETDLMQGIYLAYVETGEQEADRISHSGLEGLRDAINIRTNIKVAGVRGVDPSRDELYFYPFLYWPMTESQAALPASAARNLQNYIAQGGTIVFDTRDQQFAADDGRGPQGATLGQRRLRKLTENIQIAELMPVEKGHIIGKSFYLLNNFPGLYAGGTLWVEKEPSPDHDGVTSVFVGGNDWASAWSDAPQDRARFDRTATTGARQREIAIRFGINLAMVALAGSYKADQVHVPYILERISR
ncbi:MAG TPA: hypothetical protein DIW20_02355 [Rhodospirillaceae bacterium]|nr:hypothetical protein [Rhodospirillaceae bacterium]